MSKIVQIAELSIYGEEDEVLLENLTFYLGSGEIARLAGLSERQYDLLFHALSGEISPDSGQIVLADRNVVRLSKKNRKKMLRNEVSFLPKDFTLPERKTVIQSLKFKQEVTGPTREPEEKLEEVLRLMELVGQEEKVPEDSDSLTRVKTGLGLAIVNDPELLICHRPFSALNSNEVDSIIEVLSGVSAEKDLSILLLTDDLADRHEGVRVIESNLDSRVVG